MNMLNPTIAISVYFNMKKNEGNQMNITPRTASIRIKNMKLNFITKGITKPFAAVFATDFAGSMFVVSNIICFSPSFLVFTFFYTHTQLYWSHNQDKLLLCNTPHTLN